MNISKRYTDFTKLLTLFRQLSMVSFEIKRVMKVIPCRSGNQFIREFWAKNHYQTSTTWDGGKMASLRVFAKYLKIGLTDFN